MVESKLKVFFIVGMVLFLGVNLYIEICHGVIVPVMKFTAV